MRSPAEEGDGTEQRTIDAEVAESTAALRAHEAEQTRRDEDEDHLTRRARWADERDRRADERDARANERDKRAGERDARADQRDERADQRDVRADQREIDAQLMPRRAD